MKYQKSFEILEKIKPDAKYHLQNDVFWSNVSSMELPAESDQGKELIELGWCLQNKWFRVLSSIG